MDNGYLATMFFAICIVWSWSTNSYTLATFPLV